MRALFFGWLLPATAAGGAATLALALSFPLLLRLGRPGLLRGLCIMALALFWLPAGLFGVREIQSGVVGRALPGPIAASQQFAAQAAQPLIERAQANASDTLHTGTTMSGALPDWRAVISWIWVSVAAALLLFFAAGYLRFLCVQLRRSHPVTDTGIIGSLAAAAGQLGIKPGKKLPQLRMVLNVGGPVLVGVLRPVILLPDAPQEGELLRCALSHELCHWKAGDILLKWLALASAAVHWFNPAAWLLLEMIGRSCEYACDAAAVRGAGSGGQFAYAKALLEMHTVSVPGAASGFSAAGRSLKRRLEMIFAQEKHTCRHRLLAALAAVCVAAAGVLSGCAAAQTGSSQTRSSSLPVTVLTAEEADDGAREQQPLIFPIERESDWLSRKYVNSEHTGIDFAANFGTPILAAADGTVAEVQYSNVGYGIQILLDHRDGRETFYGHCSATAVEEGQQVEQGQVIGYVGATGNATGNFCHFELRIDGEAVDPAEALGLIVKNAQHLSAEEFTLDMVIPVGNGGYKAVGWDPDRFNERLVIAADPTASVYAPMEGTVQQTGYDPAGGNYVQLLHPDGSVSRYEHLGEVLVEEGEQLAKNELFATVGRSGEPEADTNHLTILAWQDGEPVDAAQFLIYATRYGVSPLP